MRAARASVLMVCTGNICRSPIAESVLRRRLEEASLEQAILVDSAGTHDYHVGEPPDERAQRHAARRGYDLSQRRARQVSIQDFERFDLVLAMDRGHLRILQRLCPQPERHKLRLLMEFAQDWREREVPDPYYGGAEGFEQVLDMAEAAALGLLAHLRVST